MNFKKFGLMLLAVVMVGVMLSACGNNNNGNNNAASNNGGNTATNEGAASTNSGDNAKEETKEEVSGSIVALGSSALQPLVDEAAKAFMADNPDATVNVQGGGSGTGLSQVDSGGADIGNSDVFAEEKDGIDAASLVDHKVAVVGMAAVANKNVGVDNLTKQQLIDIFTGKITNWKEVGGADVEITLVNRPKSSGTRATFYTYGLDKNEEKEGITEDSSGTVKKIIGETEGAVGYLAFSYFDDSIMPLSLDGVAPTDENVYDNSFPIWAYEHMYTKGEATGLAKVFLDYMLTDDVQQNLVPELGYIPATAMKVERAVDGTVTQK